MAAGDVAKPAQAEHAKLGLQQVAGLVEPGLPLVDPCPRVGDRIGQEPRDALRRGIRRMHLDRQEQLVGIQRSAEQIIAVGIAEVARERRAVQAILIDRPVGLAPALVYRQLDIVGRHVLQRVVQPVEPSGDIHLVGGVREHAGDREHRHDAVALHQHDVVGDVILERDLLAQQSLGDVSHCSRPPGRTAAVASAGFPAWSCRFPWSAPRSGSCGTSGSRTTSAAA